MNFVICAHIAVTSFNFCKKERHGRLLAIVQDEDIEECTAAFLTENPPPFQDINVKKEVSVTCASTGCRQEAIGKIYGFPICTDCHKEKQIGVELETL